MSVVKTEADGFNYEQVKERKIMEKLQAATSCVKKMDYESALIEFNKVLFYDKNIPEVYAEKAEIYIKLCDFSSAIQHFKKALMLKHDDGWMYKMN